MRGRSWRVAGSVLLVTLLAACSAAPSPPDEVPSTPAQTKSATPQPPSPWPPTPTESPDRTWTLRGVQPFTRLEHAAGVVLVGLIEEGVPYLTALDPATGKRRWSRPMSPAFVRRGIHLAFHIEGNQVAFLEPADGDIDLEARLVIADAKTGRSLAESSVQDFNAYPGSCDDDSGDICISTQDEDRVRFRADARDLVPDGPWPQGAYSLGPEWLVQFEDTEPRKIGVLDKGKTRWAATAESIFGAGASPDWGWGFEVDESSKIIYGTLGVKTPDAVKGFTTVDLSDDVRSAGFRSDDGKRVWYAPGWDRACSWDIELHDSAVEAALQCRFTGTARWRKGDKKTQLKVTGGELRRIDPATGDALWSVTIEDPQSVIERSDFGYLTDDVIMIRTKKPQLVDIRNGATRPATGSDLGWCGHDVEATYPEPWYVDDKPEPDSRHLYSDRSYQPCTGTKLNVLAQPPSIPKSVGIDVDGTTVVAMPDRIVGFR